MTLSHTCFGGQKTYATNFHSIYRYDMQNDILNTQKKPNYSLKKLQKTLQNLMLTPWCYGQMHP